MHENFYFLKNSYPRLYENIFLAIKYVNEDSDACLYKTRKVSEQMVEIVLKKESIEYELTNNYFDKLKVLEAQCIIDEKYIEAFPNIRMLGNEAVHSFKSSIDLAKKSLSLVHMISCWIYKRYNDPKFIEKQFVYLNYKYEVGEEVRQIKPDERELFNTMLRIISTYIGRVIVNEKLMGFGSTIEIKYMTFSEFYSYFEKTLDFMANTEPENLINEIVEFKNIGRKIFMINDDVEIVKRVAIILYNRTHWAQVV